MSERVRRRDLSERRSIRWPWIAVRSPGKPKREWPEALTGQNFADLAFRSRPTPYVLRDSHQTTVFEMRGLTVHDRSKITFTKSPPRDCRRTDDLPGGGASSGGVSRMTGCSSPSRRAGKSYLPRLGGSAFTSWVACVPKSKSAGRGSPRSSTAGCTSAASHRWPAIAQTRTRTDPNARIYGVRP